MTLKNALYLRRKPSHYPLDVMVRMMNNQPVRSKLPELQLMKILTPAWRKEMLKGR